MRVVNRAGTGLNDRGVDVEFRPGGGILALVQVETNLDAAINDYRAVLRAFDDDAARRRPLRRHRRRRACRSGEPDTVPGSLLVLRRPDLGLGRDARWATTPTPSSRA